MLTPDDIRAFMDGDSASDKKHYARIGEKYYGGEHDIRHYRIFFMDANGDIKEDKTKSNIKICHPFFSELVEQCTQYMLSGKEGFVKSDIPELQKQLDDYFNDNEDFQSELYDLLTGTQAKGFEYLYAYKGEDGKTRFECADSMGVVEVRARDTDDDCDYIIYWYIDHIGKDNKKIKRIQVWDDAQTWFYSQVDDGEIMEDIDEEINPRPHTLYHKGDDGKTYFDGYGLIPFFRMDNNRQQVSDLRAVKDLIDDYDLMSCGLSNNIQDTNEALYVVKGFEGDNLDELMLNIRAKKHIGVGENGDVEIRTIDIPYEARQAKLDLDERNIYRFGCGFNINGLRDTTATTNVAIKSAYSQLDLKANKLEIRLKQLMRKLLRLVLDEINQADGTDYSLSDVYFNFEREVPTNALENAQIELTEAQKRQTEVNTILNLQTVIDEETRLKLIAEQLDVDYQELRDKLPKDEDGGLYQAQTALDHMTVDGA